MNFEQVLCSFAYPAHRLSLLFDLLQVLVEIDADVYHQVLCNQLPLARVVVHLIQDVQKRLVAGQPVVREERGEGKGGDRGTC